MTNHSELNVILAYQKALQMQVRQMEIEKSRYETQWEAEERLDAICKHAEIELQYIAQFTY